MPRLLIPSLGLFALLTAAACPLVAHAEQILFESGTLGPTGLVSGDDAAANISADVFFGVRFSLQSPVATSQVGGHFFGEGTFFGSLVALDSADDLPDFGDLSGSDVIDTALLTFPSTSSEVFGDITANLPAGDYALVFGSGVFGALGDGAAPLNNPNIGDQTFIVSTTSSSTGAFSVPINPIFNNFRFVVTGTPVPEPSSIITVLVVVGLLPWSSLHRLR